MKNKIKFNFPIVIVLVLAICHSFYLFNSKESFYSKQNFIQYYDHPISCTVTLIKRNISSLKITFRNLKVTLEVSDNSDKRISIEKINDNLNEIKNYLAILPRQHTNILSEPSFFFRDCTDDTRPIVEMTIDQIKDQIQKDEILNNQSAIFSFKKLLALIFFYLVNIIIYIYFAGTYEKKK